MPAIAYPLVLRRRTTPGRVSVRVPILLTRTHVAWGVVGPMQREWSGRAARWATPAALAYGTVFPLLQLALVAEYPASDGDVRWALLATAVYLPLHLHHVYWSVRGVRPPGALWTLAALAAVVAATVPVGGTHWLPVFAIVAVSAVLVLPWPWSLVVAGGVTLGMAPLALAIDSPIPSAPSYYVFTVWWRASALFVPLWLLGSVRQLEAARRALAEDAVVRERLRIDREVRRTVGTALDSIAAGGGNVAARLALASGTGSPGGDAALAADVRALAEDSRRALAETRRLVSGYRRPSLAAELETAATLLAAAGVDARVEPPPETLPPDAGAGVRSALRDATAAVLRDETATSCVITVDYESGQAKLKIRTNTTPMTPPTAPSPAASGPAGSGTAEAGAAEAGAAGAGATQPDAAGAGAAGAGAAGAGATQPDAAGAAGAGAAGAAGAGAAGAGAAGAGAAGAGAAGAGAAGAGAAGAGAAGSGAAQAGAGGVGDGAPGGLS